MFNNAHIQKEYRKTTTRIIIGAILLTAALALLLTSVIRTLQFNRNAEHLNDLIISNDENRKDRIAYLDTVGFYQVATYGDDLGYYIAYDDEFYYIISIKEKDWDYFAEQFDDKDEIRLWGYTREIPVELKSYAIDSLNEDYPDAHVSITDFEDIFGDLLLSAGKEASVRGLGGWYELNAPFIFGSLPLALFGIILLLTGLNSRKSFAVLKDDAFGGNAIIDEINDPETVSYDNDTLFLTRNHLVSTKESVHAIDYQDIFWMYVTSHRTNGIHDYDFLNIITKDGKTISCFNSPTLGKKKREETKDVHIELMEALSQRNPDIRIGYVQENIEAFQELQKDLKNKKEAGDIQI